jgi:N-acyl-D-amino-acid deacylase
VLNRSTLAAPAALIACRAAAQADEPEAAAQQSKISHAVVRGLAIVQKAAASYPKNRNCFSCHHQTLPMLAMVAARERKAATDEGLLNAQAEFTHQSFQGRIEPMKEGMGIGGISMTVGYGLWALDLAGWKPDETTEAMVTYLLKNQKEDGHWTFQTERPPLEASHVTSTVLAAYYMPKFAAESQRDEVEAAVVRARKWLETAPADSQEDLVMSLWGQHLLGTDRERLAKTRDQVLAAQRDDGGWAQLSSMTSDAYATGQTLYILRASGLPASAAAFQRGVAYLLKTQCDDGSWRVETRSKPIQVFFDNGDPHGEHQFISIPATAWSVAALAAALDREPAE